MLVARDGQDVADHVAALTPERARAIGAGGPRAHPGATTPTASAAPRWTRCSGGARQRASGVKDVVVVWAQPVLVLGQRPRHDLPRVAAGVGGARPRRAVPGARRALVRERTATCRRRISAAWHCTATWPASDAWSDDRPADAVIVGSYVPEGVAVGRMVQRTARGVTAFYDIDTPVTLASWRRRRGVPVAGLIPGYDLYLSFTGGPILDRISNGSTARRGAAAVLLGGPGLYRPTERRHARGTLGYLGTYSDDRQPTLDRLLLEPARRAPAAAVRGRRAAVSGRRRVAANVERIEHLRARRPPRFLCRQPLHAQRHPRRHDPRRLQPQRAPVRGGGLRDAASSATAGTG